MGYGRPDWSIVSKPEYILGWNHDDNGWWFADSKTTYYKSSWHIINGHKYRFNLDGYALIGWQEIDGKYYYFEPRTGHDLECALYVSDQYGAQGVWSF
jgi:glucan-binding YG repeat protein